MSFMLQIWMKLKVRMLLMMSNFDNHDYDDDTDDDKAWRRGDLLLVGQPASWSPKCNSGVRPVADAGVYGSQARPPRAPRSQRPMGPLRPWALGSMGPQPWDPMGPHGI